MLFVESSKGVFCFCFFILDHEKKEVETSQCTEIIPPHPTLTPNNNVQAKRSRDMRETPFLGCLQTNIISKHFPLNFEKVPFIITNQNGKTLSSIDSHLKHHTDAYPRTLFGFGCVRARVIPLGTNLIKTVYTRKS